MTDYFTPDGNPVAQSRGVSSQLRTLFTAIQTGFGKVAGYTGNGGKLVRINSGATAQEAMALGTANQVVGMNAGATGYEHKTVAGTAAEITVTHGVGTVTASLPTALTFTGKTVTGGTYESPAINTPTISTPTITGGSFTGGTDIAVADGGTGASNASDARTNLGLAIGTDVQAYDADLSAVAGLSSNGIIARTGSGTASVRTITAPAAGITVSNGDGVSGNPTLALANDLAALEGLSATGMIARTGDGTASARTITAGSGCSVANGDGVSGNPTISLVPGIGLGDVLSSGAVTADTLVQHSGTTGQVVKQSTLTGILKATSGVPAAAVSGTDYLAPPSGSSILKANSGGALANAVSGTDYCPATSGSGLLKASSGGTAPVVSGTDIKTVGGVSILGSGNIDIGLVTRSDRTSNTILGASDHGKLIDITSGTFTQTFTAAATLGSGWYCYYRNSGTGDVTLDPDAAEQIDGLASFIMYPGECRLIQCTGTAFTSVVLSPFFKTITTTGTFTKPPGYSAFGLGMWSGGASGAKCPSATGYQSGAGGGYGEFSIPVSAVGSTETVTIGAGGAAVSVDSTNGNIGGDSSFGTLAVVYAGTAAGFGGSIFSGVTSATSDYAKGAIGQVTPVTMFWGGSGISSTGANASGSTKYGGAAGGSHDGTNLRAAGTSIFGGNGGAASVSGNATDGTAPGGGGGMGKDAVGNSGAGARGEARIWGMV